MEARKGGSGGGGEVPLSAPPPPRPPACRFDTLLYFTFYSTIVQIVIRNPSGSWMARRDISSNHRDPVFSVLRGELRKIRFKERLASFLDLHVTALLTARGIAPR